MGGRAAAMWPGLCSAPLAPALRTSRKRLPPLAAHTLGVNSERYLNVTGPVAVITGAASGIGAACAERFRHDGWRIAAIDLHDSDADLAVTADSQAVLPGMRAAGHGRIVIITSGWGVIGHSNATAYAASKAGLIALTKGLGRELGPQ